ncbi:hypothetical protein [Actinomadura montaniterrae]|uniref:Uncharacterized protein n=1 Tax=Actinomadura montaniterrae TaxID=1803903 RepID=A0A6L3VT48_9ACTN|nr:hypothetical protein [Actinomadura montaniterrae]KAB2380121.1 hypothetical protein F9B16_18245 [Actinomadura montaniterrae]
MAVFVISGGSWSVALQGIAFFLGAGGMMVMFYRWRRQGDRRAAALVVPAFATWALAVALASATGVEPGTPAFWIAGVALLIGVGGGAVTLARMHRERRNESESSSPEQG